MIIKKLELISFGKFKDYKIELQDGVNLVYGENESGKSTLHSFINGMFYAFLKPFTKKTIYSEEHENYNPIYSNLYRGNLEFCMDDVIYRIERDFKKGHENTRIYEKLTGEDITYKARDLSAGKVVQPGNYFFGLSDLVFKNTVFISQKGINTDDKLADEVRDRLVNVVTSKDENISVKKAIDILDTDFKEIGSERAYTSKYGLLLKNLSDKRAELKGIQEKRSIYKEWLEKAEDINIKRENLGIKVIKEEELLKQFSLNKKLKKYNRALDLEKKVKLLHKEISNLSQFKNINIEDYSNAEYLDYDIKNLSLGIEKTKSEIENIEYKKNSIDIVDELQIKEWDRIIEDGLRVQYIEEQIRNNSLPNTQEIVSKNGKNIKNIKIVSGLLFFIYLFLAVYSIGTRNFTLLAATQLIILVIIFLFYKSKLHKDDLKLLKDDQDSSQDIINIISKYGIHTSGEFIEKVKYAKSKRDEIEDQKRELLKLNDRIDIMKDNLRKTEESLSDNKNDLDKVLDKNKQNTLEDFKKSKLGKLRLEEMQKEFLYTNKELANILDGKTIEDLKVDKEKVKAFYDDQQNLKEEIILDKLKVLKTGLESLNLDYKECEVQIKNLEIRIFKEASLKEDIWNLESKINSLDKKKTSIQYAINRIKELSTDVHRDYAPIINKKVGHMVNKITEGKYKTVKIDKDLNVSLQSQDGDSLIDFNKLSAGTIDQIYFSLRMGLTEEIIHKKLPLVFDESFARYDDRRLETILRFLMEKESKGQIILFTCHKREKRILDKLGIDYNYIQL